MTNLDLPARRRISARAAQYLREEEAYWTKRYWLCDLDLMEDEQYDTTEINADVDTKFAIGHSSTIGRVRGWLREHNFGARNRRCGVCSEGALLLALAEDPSVPDEARGEDLLRFFETDARKAARAIDLDDWPGIVYWNDQQAGGEDEVITLLDAMGSLEESE